MPNQPRPRPINEPNTITSADRKYYAGNQRSAISRSSFEKQHPPKPIPTPPAVDPNRRVSRDTLRSADEYYANQGGRPRAEQPVKQAPGGAVSIASNVEGTGAGPFTIPLASALREGMEQAIESVKAGYAPVYVALGHKGLIAHARQAIEMAVTREEITEDQGRDIKLGLARPPQDENPGAKHKREFQEKLAENETKPIQPGADPTDMLGLDIDAEAFVAGEDPAPEPCPPGPTGPQGPPGEDDRVKFDRIVAPAFTEDAEAQFAVKEGQDVPEPDQEEPDLDEIDDELGL